MRKSKQEMLDDVLSRLQAQGGVTETSPGSIARMFAETIIEELNPIYDELDIASAMGFVSTASGSYLDLIGELLNCIRSEEESDEEYRARIVNQVTVSQSANLTAIRIQALQVEGVADVQLKRYTHGAGSFTCYVIPQVFPIENDLLVRVEEALENVIAYGMNMQVRVSEYVPVDINIRLIFHSKTVQVERDHIRHDVTSRIEDYMENMNRGTKIIINEIVERTMAASDQIVDMEIKEIQVNNKQYFIKNIEPTKEDRYFLRQISVV